MVKTVLRSKLWKYLPVIAVVIAGVLSSAVVSHMVQKSREEYVMQSFMVTANERAAIVHRSIENEIALLRAMGTFFHASDTISREEFDSMVGQLAKDHPAVQAVQWIPRVDATERVAYELEMQKYNGDFRFTERGVGGELVPVAERNRYYPVYYSYSFMGRDALLGYDVMSDLTYSVAMQQAEETGEIVATGRVLLPQFKREQRYSTVLMAPVYKRGGNANTNADIRGYLALVLPVHRVFDSAFESLSSTGMNIIVRDHSALRTESQLYVRISRDEKVMQEQDIIRSETRRGQLVNKSTLDVAGRNWELTFLPATGYFSFSFSMQAGFVLGAGLLITLLLAAFLMNQMNKWGHIQDEVAERTHELEESRMRMQLLLDSTNDGVLGLDAKGCITFINSHALELLQYGKDEVIGKMHHELLQHSREDGTPYPADACPMEAAFRDGKVHTARDEIFWRKDATQLPVEYTCATLREDGEVTGAVVAFRDISERKQYLDNLKQLAQYDQLTGVANRNLFLEFMRKAFSRAERDKTIIGLIYFDLNNFKDINDTMGHAAGDAVLRAFARRIGEGLRAYDIVARLGGDEFTILLDNLASREECIIVVERILRMLEAPLLINDKEIMVSASIGVAFYPDDSQNIDELLSHADTAMYVSKNNGSLRYHVAGSNLDGAHGLGVVKSA
jgi:diguanylate cyclase (GGDEF)-like protein/PAS domain S-box-containing protein